MSWFSAMAGMYGEEWVKGASHEYNKRYDKNPLYVVAIFPNRVTFRLIVDEYIKCLELVLIIEWLVTALRYMGTRSRTEKFFKKVNNTFTINFDAVQVYFDEDIMYNIHGVPCSGLICSSTLTSDEFEPYSTVSSRTTYLSEGLWKVVWVR